MKTIFPWRNPPHGTSPSLISLHGACCFFFLLFCCYPKLIPKPELYVCRFPTQRLAVVFCSTLNNSAKQTISASESFAPECSVCFRSIVFFQRQRFFLSALRMNSCARTSHAERPHALVSDAYVAVLLLSRLSFMPSQLSNFYLCGPFLLHDSLSFLFSLLPALWLAGWCLGWGHVPKERRLPVGLLSAHVTAATVHVLSRVSPIPPKCLICSISIGRRIELLSPQLLHFIVFLTSFLLLFLHLWPFPALFQVLCLFALCFFLPRPHLHHLSLSLMFYHHLSSPPPYLPVCFLPLANIFSISPDFEL